MIKRREKMIELTPRERDVLLWLKCGRSTEEIAAILKISGRTVKYHVSNVIDKLGAENRLHALAIAMERGLLP
jgi:LuxR family transcriptional regulator, quorum-sensing system regulator CviR